MSFILKTRSVFYSAMALTLGLTVAMSATAQIIDPWEDIPEPDRGFLGGIQGGAGAAAGQASMSSKDLPELVGSVIQQLMGLVGVVLVVLVIYAGFLWMTAQGNDEKIKKAKGIISSAVIGLALVFAGWAITEFVVRAIDTASQEAVVPALPPAPPAE